MPFALVFLGLLMIVTGAQDTYAAFGNQVQQDFTGEKNFTTWLLAIGGIGALGYIDQLRFFSRMFLVLIIIAMVLANGGFFDKFQQALASGPVAPPQPASPNGPGAWNGQPAILSDPKVAQGLSEAQGMLHPGEGTGTENATSIMGGIFGALLTRLSPVGAFFGTVFGSKPAY